MSRRGTAPESTAGLFHARGSRPAARRRTRPARRHALRAESLEPRRLLVGNVAGFVFQDLNANNVYDTGEGLSNWRVYSDTNADGQFTSGEPNTMTSSTGAYTLYNLTAGSVLLRTIVPTGWQAASPATGQRAVTVVDNQTIGSNNFQNTLTGTLVTGFVWNDVNADGAKGTTETGVLPGPVYADLNLNGSLDSATEPSANPASDGTYQLTVPAGIAATIRHVANSTSKRTTPSTGSYAVTTEAGARLTGRNFGYLIPATVSGNFYEDINGNGVKDSTETIPLVGWTVYADLNGNGSQDGTEPAAVTSSSGYYTLVIPTDGTPASVTIRQQVQAGWTATQANGGSFAFTATSGAYQSARNFLNRTAGGLVSGLIWNDANGNGVKDSTESILAGRTVYADIDSDGALSAGDPSAVTRSDGTYQLVVLTEGTFPIRQVVPTNWLQTAPSAGGSFSASIGLGTATSIGSRATGINFGNKLTAGLVSGTLFNDANGSGSRDAAEVGLAGWRVFADLNSNGTADVGEPTATSSASGSYELYVAVQASGSMFFPVRTQTEAGWRATQPVGGQYSVMLSTAQMMASVPVFGFMQPVAVVSGLLWRDLNGNGARDVSESTQPGLGTVYADLNGNAALDFNEPRTGTAADGTYQLPLAAAGSYTIRQVVQSGWRQTSPAGGGAYSVTVAANDQVTGRDFGVVPTTGTVWGWVFDDANANGTRDTGEVGLTNWRVYADLNENGAFDTGEPSQLTSSSGWYSFTVSTDGLSRNVVVRPQSQAGYEVLRPFGGQSVVQVVSGASVSRDFVVRSSSAAGAIVGGTLWNDLNGDAVRSSDEPRLSGWSVYVDLNNNSLADTGEPRVSTDASGAYTFLLSTPGTYTIRQLLNGGWVAGSPAGGSYAVQVDATSRILDRDFANRGTTGTVTGFVFDDTNGNGVQEAGEAALVNWRVYADLNENQVLDTGEPASMTSTNGQYYLSVPTPNGARTVTLREQVATGWQATLPATGSQSVVVNGGLTASGRNFGNQPQSTIAMVTGRLWNDLDADGIRDTNEYPLSGRMVYLDLNNNQVADSSEPKATTATDGGYQFVVGEIGTYTARQVLPSGWVQTSPDGAAQVVTVSQMGLRLTGRDFGSRSTVASVSGTVFQDLDADGVLDSGESGVSGWRVYADLDADGEFDANEPTATTSSSGFYMLQVPLATLSANVSIREQIPSGWQATLPVGGQRVVSLTAGQTLSSVNFGNALGGAIFSGVVWNDTNANGTRDSGEASLSGWTVYADINGNAAFDQGEPSVGTSFDGTYQLVIPTLSASTYTIREVVQPGWIVTVPAGGSSTSAVTAGGRYTANFGNRYAIGTVSGVVFQDWNGSGTQDAGDGPLAGWRVYADLDADGVFDADEPTAVTSNSGSYSFAVTTNGTPLSVIVRGVVPAGWMATQPSTGSRSITVTGGQSVSGINFGTRSTKPVVMGTLWNDTIANGVRDSGETSLSGWTVYADVDGDAVADADEAKAVTEYDGSYLLLLPQAGSYTIRPVLSRGWVATAPVGGSHAVTVADGAVLTGKNFGSRYTIGSISGTVFDDTDGDGVKSAAESGLANWQVFADLDDDGVLDAGEPSTRTSATGSYALPGLVEGTLAMRVRPLTGWEPSAGGGRLSVQVIGGQTAGSQNFGCRVVSSAALITGSLFNDLNANGLRDSNETALSGWTVYVDADGDAVLDAGEVATKTGSDGTYSLIVSATGSYVIRQVVQTNWVQTLPEAGTLTVAVPSLGTRLQNNNFGARYTIGSVTGTVFDDWNQNGSRDTGEAALAGWRVYADLNDDGVLDQGEPTATTSTTGSYFLNVPVAGASSTVKVRTVVPTGWQATLPAGGGQSVTLSGGQTVGGKNFGNLLTGALMSGTLWNDANANGARDTGEAVLSGWTVYADADGDSVLDPDEAKSVTGADGTFQLTILSAGAYTLRAVALSGWTVTAPAGAGHAVTAVLGTRTTAKDFGVRYLLGTVTGVVFNDLNGDGVQDAGEAPLSGWIAYVDANGNGIRDAGELTSTTSTTGTYSFRLLEGTVSIRLQMLANWQATLPSGGAQSVVVQGAKTASGWNFGVRQPPTA